MLVAENPSLVSKIVIGQSYQGRALNVLKVSKAQFGISIVLLLHSLPRFQPCPSSALVDPNVPPSGSTLESTPGSGSLRLVAPGLPKR